MHFGRKNPRQRYFFLKEDTLHFLEVSDSERDLGVQITYDLNWSEHVSKVCSTANRVLGMLRRTFQHNSVDLWRRLYLTYIRPHLEFAVAAWRPNRIGLIGELEKVQRRATKVPFTLRHLPYEARLAALGIQKLETRRDRGDLIQFFKLTRGLESVDWRFPPNALPSLSLSGPAGATRGHRSRLCKQYFDSRTRNDHAAAVSSRLNFISNRVVNNCNALPQEAVDARSLNVFKARIDELSENKIL